MECTENWPEETASAAEHIYNIHGEPHEVTDTSLTWHNVGHWKKILVTRDSDAHNFPAPHNDCVECVVLFDVPPEKLEELANFDGSISVNITNGEMSSRCYSEKANNLILNLACDIIRGRKDVEQARSHMANEFLCACSLDETPYMDTLWFEPQKRSGEPDEAILKKSEIEQAQLEGAFKEPSGG